MLTQLIAGLLVTALGGVAAGQQTTAAAPAGHFMVFFDWGKPDIRGDDAATLDQVAAAYRSNPGAKLQLAGNTDRSGNQLTNRAAGLRRARTVRAQLEERGVPAAAMTVVSYGEEQPLVPTADGVREVQNRRVEIAIEGPTLTSGAMPVPFPIVGQAGEQRGFATFFSDGRRTAIKVEAEGLAPGVHGIHLHAVGRCDGPDFKSAGGHWNPAGLQHGHDNPKGAHLGDLPNLSVGSDGRGTASFTVDGDMADADGTSLVIHADPDDDKTDPSGNSGARIACAVLTTPAQP